MAHYLYECHMLDSGYQLLLTRLVFDLTTTHEGFSLLLVALCHVKDVGCLDDKVLTDSWYWFSWY